MSTLTGLSQYQSFELWKKTLSTVEKHTEKETEKAEWLALSSWCLKEMFNKGLIKDFSQKDFTILKFVNQNYNKAADGRYSDSDQFFYLMVGDDAAAKISDEGFKKIKEIYKQNYDKK